MSSYSDYKVGAIDEEMFIMSVNREARRDKKLTEDEESGEEEDES